MRGMFGISELHRRSASGVQAARCSAVPTAKLELEKATRRYGESKRARSDFGNPSHDFLLCWVINDTATLAWCKRGVRDGRHKATNVARMSAATCGFFGA